ncbi:MAG TPA: DUF3367 domain-containing protein [Micromonosporaceae bacterium]|nr:DUF3367 domain-containing protein [Micromonosporaceae bacterium]HCU52633.1 DUF3367 domain-containing protein [Micromonosporaceae bacterium]
MTSKAVQRLRVMAVCMLLTGLAFRQDPGFTSPDTKVDLTVNPIGLLARSMQLWDPAGNFGQLQNQAYGYLWPMGPFHAVLHLLNVPAWASQRLWWALVLCVAFTGVVRLAGKLNIGTPGSRLVAGAAFALSVRTLTELGGISVEAWPSAIAPWVLVPLAGLPAGTRLRKPIAWSAVAVACAGGVNATAVFAVVPLALLWLFSLQSTRQRFVAVVGWCVAVALATAWWILPLLILGRYAPPFLNFIETAQVTTHVTDMQTMMRGASHWQAYFTDIYGPVWPAGKRLATDRLLIWSSAAVAAIGLAGLARRGMPHRRFLITGLLMGLAMVGFGHVAALGGAFPEWQRSLLDGAAVAFRNVHKFDVVIRLPLALGLAHFVGVFMAAAAQRPRSDRARLRALAATALALLAIFGVASPAMGGNLTARGKYVSVPAYWYQASDWLDKNLDEDRVLLVPGARFGDYRWGSTGDEVIQSLLDGRWGVRNAIPLAPPGTIRFLDAVDSAITTGSGSPGLADLLARAGIRYVLVRADIDYGKSGSAAPVIVRQALARSPGLAPVIHFGPEIGASTTGAFLDRGLAGPVPALEVFEVQRKVRPVAVHELSAVTTVVGGPESLLALASSEALPAGPTVLAGDVPTGMPIGNVILTDGLRRREVNFGLGRDNASATLDAKQPWRGTGPAPDYLPSWAQNWLTVAAYSGITSITASSSWSDLPGLVGSRPAHHPFAAIDGDPATSWRAAPGRPSQGQWVEVRFPGPQIIPEIKLIFDPGAAALPTKVTVDTGGEQVTAESFGNTATVKLGGQLATARVKVTIDSVISRETGEGAVGIAEIQIPGLRASRHLVTPMLPPTGQLSTMMFTAAPTVPSCYFLASATYCDPARARESEDGSIVARSFTLKNAGRFLPSIWARPQPGPALDTALALSKLHTTAASSAASLDPTSSPAAVIDGDLGTAWLPAETDEHPWLRLNWTQERTITGLTIAMTGGVAASRPWGVQIVGDAGMQVGVVDANGVVVFDKPMKTDEVTIFFIGSMQGFSRNPYENKLEKLTIAVGEITALPESPRLSPDSSEVITLPCGSGPTLQVDGETRQTALVATRLELRELREVPAVLCGANRKELELGAGPHQLVASSSEWAAPARVGLTASGQSPPAAEETVVHVDSWGSGERRLTIPVLPTARLLTVRENNNPGWVATAGGKTLTPIVVDGWQQGWLVPAGTGGTVVLKFAPEWTFRAALLVGAGALGLVLLAAMLPGNRRPAYVPGRHRFRREGLYVFGGLALVFVGGLVGVGLAVAGVMMFFVARLLGRRMSRQDQVKLGGAVRWLWLLPPALFLFGTWLADGLAEPHTALWPQVTGLSAVVLLWLSAYWPLRAGPRPAPIDGWAFDAVPADGGQHQTTRHGEDVHPQRIPAEGRYAGYLVDEVHGERMPQKQSIGDGS